MRALALSVILGCRAAPSEAEARRSAEAIWQTRCVNCHGAQGHGDGPGARLLPVRPRDFSDPAWQAAVDDERIARVIVEGGAPLGLDANMAANGDLQRAPEVVAALVEMVRGR